MDSVRKSWLNVAKRSMVGDLRVLDRTAAALKETATYAVWEYAERKNELAGTGPWPEIAEHVDHAFRDLVDTKWIVRLVPTTRYRLRESKSEKTARKRTV